MPVKDPGRIELIDADVPTVRELLGYEGGPPRASSAAASAPPEWHPEHQRWREGLLSGSPGAAIPGPRAADLPPYQQGQDFFQDPLGELGRGGAYAWEDITGHLGKPFPDAASGVAGAGINALLSLLSFPSREISPRLVGSASSFLAGGEYGDFFSPESKARGEYLREELTSELPVDLGEYNLGPVGTYNLDLGTFPAELAYDILTDPSSLLFGAGTAAKAAKFAKVGKVLDQASIFPGQVLIKPMQGLGKVLKGSGITKLSGKGEYHQRLLKTDLMFVHLLEEGNEQFIPKFNAMMQGDRAAAQVSDFTMEHVHGEGRAHFAKVLGTWQRKLNKDPGLWGPETADKTQTAMMRALANAERRSLGVKGPPTTTLGKVWAGSFQLVKEIWLPFNVAWHMQNTFDNLVKTMLDGSIATSTYWDTAAFKKMGLDVKDRVKGTSFIENVLGSEGLLAREALKEEVAYTSILPAWTGVNKLFEFSHWNESIFRRIAYTKKFAERWPVRRETFLADAYPGLVDAGFDASDVAMRLDKLRRRKHFKASDFVREFSSPPNTKYNASDMSGGPQGDPGPLGGDSFNAYQASLAANPKYKADQSVAKRLRAVREAGEEQIDQINNTVVRQVQQRHAIKEKLAKDTNPVDVSTQDKANAVFARSSQVVIDAIEHAPTEYAALAAIALLRQMTWLRGRTVQMAKAVEYNDAEDFWLFHRTFTGQMVEQVDDTLAEIADLSVVSPGTAEVLMDVRATAVKLRQRVREELDWAKDKVDRGAPRGNVLDHRDDNLYVVTSNEHADFAARHKEVLGHNENVLNAAGFAPVKQFVSGLEGLITKQISDSGAGYESLFRNWDQAKRSIYDDMTRQRYALLGVSGIFHPRHGALHPIAGGRVLGVGQRDGTRAVQGHGITDPTVPWDFMYDVVPEQDLVASHIGKGLDGITGNPAFPPGDEWQPRIRGIRQHAETTQHRMLTLHPDTLLTPTAINSGPPIVAEVDGVENVILSGNGRVNSLRWAKDDNPGGAQQYFALVEKDASEYGITPEMYQKAAAAGDGNVVLVRRFEGEREEKIALVKDANASPVAGFTGTEGAMKESGFFSLHELSQFKIAASSTFEDALDVSGESFRGPWAERFSRGELMQWENDKGELNLAGKARLADVALAKVFPGEGNYAFLQALTEDKLAGVAKIKNGLRDALPKLAALGSKVEIGHYPEEYLLNDRLVPAIQYIQAVRSGSGRVRGQTVAMRLAVSPMDIALGKLPAGIPDEVALALTMAVEKMTGVGGSQKRFRGFLERYVDLVLAEPPTQQLGMQLEGVAARERPPAVVLIREALTAEGGRTQFDAVLKERDEGVRLVQSSGLSPDEQAAGIASVNKVAELKTALAAEQVVLGNLPVSKAVSGEGLEEMFVPQAAVEQAEGIVPPAAVEQVEDIVPPAAAEQAEDMAPRVTPQAAAGQSSMWAEDTVPPAAPAADPEQATRAKARKATRGATEQGFGGGGANSEPPMHLGGDVPMPPDKGKADAKVRELGQKLQQIIVELDKESIEHVGEKLFNYGDRMKVDEVLSPYSPFTIWQLRNVPYWMNEVAEKPWLARAIKDHIEDTEEEREKRNLTNRFRHTVPIGTAGDGETELRANLLKTVVSGASQVTQPFVFGGGDEGLGPQGATWLGGSLETLMQFAGNLSLYPQFYLPLYLAGAFGEVPYGDIAPQSRLGRGIVDVVGGDPRIGRVDPEREIQHGVREAGRYVADVSEKLGLEGVVPGVRQTAHTGNVFKDGQVRRRIAEYVRRGGANNAAALSAMDDPDSPLWKKALADVESENNRLGLARYFIPLNIKGLTKEEAEFRQIQTTLPESEVWDEEDSKEYRRILESEPGFAAYRARFKEPLGRAILAEMGEYYAIGPKAVLDRIEATPSEGRRELYAADSEAAAVRDARRAYLAQHPKLTGYFRRDREAAPSLDDYVQQEAGGVRADRQAEKEMGQSKARVAAQMQVGEAAGQEAADLSLLKIEYAKIKPPGYDEYYALPAGARRAAWRQRHSAEEYLAIRQASIARYEFARDNPLLAQWWWYVQDNELWTDPEATRTFLTALESGDAPSVEEARGELEDKIAEARGWLAGYLPGAGRAPRAPRAPRKRYPRDLGSRITNPYSRAAG